jgi:hypothetical protein
MSISIDILDLCSSLREILDLYGYLVPWCTWLSHHWIQSAACCAGDNLVSPGARSAWIRVITRERNRMGAYVVHRIVYWLSIGIVCVFSSHCIS